MMLLLIILEREHPPFGRLKVLKEKFILALWANYIARAQKC